MSDVDKILAGDIRTAARLMRDLDDRRPSALETLKALYPHTGKAYIVGVTGNPGAGKSTVVDALIAHYRAAKEIGPAAGSAVLPPGAKEIGPAAGSAVRPPGAKEIGPAAGSAVLTPGAGERVGVVCVDPTSPFTGGAILGDRIRMQRHALDPDVFIRSLATRGHLGGLSRSTFDVVHVLDAMGFTRILIETVGVGQDEVEVMKAAHTTVVVTVPGLGDDIQAIKAGLLEVADVLAVNKADREGADRTERDLLNMLDLRAHGERKEVEIVRTIATRGIAEGSGIAELGAAIERHRDRAWRGPDGEPRAIARATAHLAELVRGLLADRAAKATSERGGLAEIARSVIERRADPWSVAEQLVGNAPT